MRNGSAAGGCPGKSVVNSTPNSARVAGGFWAVWMVICVSVVPVPESVALAVMICVPLLSVAALVALVGRRNGGGFVGTGEAAGVVTILEGGAK